MTDTIPLVVMPLLPAGWCNPLGWHCFDCGRPVCSSPQALQALTQDGASLVCHYCGVEFDGSRIVYGLLTPPQIREVRPENKHRVRPLDQEDR